MKRLAFTCLAVVVTAGGSFAQDQSRNQNQPSQNQPTQNQQDRTRQDQAQQNQNRNTSIRPRSEAFAMAHRSEKATELMGKKVVNASNEDLGKLEDIVVDANSGRILYGVLSFGGFLGIGDKLFAIPWESLDIPAGDKGAIVLNVSKDRLKSAEGFDSAHWPDFANQEWSTKTYKYYEQTPYWQNTGETTRTDATGKNQNYRDRWYQPVTVWQKCSDLCGKDIHNMQNEDLGRISDCVVDPDGGRLLYGILAHNGKRYAIPWNALTLSGDAKRFQINMTKEQIDSAPALAGDTWPNVSDERWAMEVHRYYKVQPYWTEVTIEEER